MQDNVSVEPVQEPVTLAELKEHRKVTTTAEDAIMFTYLKVARRRVELLARRALLEQTRILTLDCWPTYARQMVRYGRFAGRLIELPRAPLLSVESVTYYDTDEASQTFAASNYTVDLTSAPGRLVLNTDASWPDLYDRPAAVTITYKAGYGTEPEDVPDDLRLAILHLAAHYHKEREPMTVASLRPIPHHVDALIDGQRVIA